jgi:hypothetical protein
MLGNESSAWLDMQIANAIYVLASAILWRSQLTKTWHISGFRKYV